jgi:hypothetical protein
LVATVGGTVGKCYNHVLGNYETVGEIQTVNEWSLKIPLKCFVSNSNPQCTVVTLSRSVTHSV